MTKISRLLIEQDVNDPECHGTSVQDQIQCCAKPGVDAIECMVLHFEH